MAKKKASTKASRAVKAPAVKATAVKAAAVKEAFTKSELLTSIADNTGLSRKEVGNVLEELSNAIARHIKPKGPGEFKMPGLFKIKTIKKKATKARKGINPFTGEEPLFKAKPARTVVKVQALKKLKEMVQYAVATLARQLKKKARFFFCGW